ncbi:hypothetical protein E4U91_22435 [Streptomyces lasalocidi]|uniref:Uncharacterized protein n=1 Tax=Streptomyces lasalocidi TaxID=324833 RepID=A0A4U5WKM2_STRLS|nr:hypothetical protein E4U91_22435 [Streptomyces lasalocidi]
MTRPEPMHVLPPCVWTDDERDLMRLGHVSRERGGRARTHGPAGRPFGPDPGRASGRRSGRTRSRRRNLLQPLAIEP